jgi:hypothetical protein
MVGERLEGTQQLHFNSLLKSKYDGIFVHSQFARDLIRRHIQNTFFTPIGFEKRVFGEPAYAGKLYDVVWYGSYNVAAPGKRALVHQIARKLKCKFHDISGAFLSDRQKLLNKSRLILHIQYYKGTSFTSMRLWQAVGSSAVMLIEPMDTFPAEPGKHYIQIPEINEDNIPQIAAAIDKAAARSDLIDIARKAYGDLSQYTYRRCMEEYVIPASKQIVHCKHRT